jgi:dihydroorotase
MCRSAWCVRTGVDVFSDLLDTVDRGQPIQHALCVRVADLLSAHASAYIVFDTDAHVCTMTCWPLTLDVARLKVVVEHLPHAFPLLVRHQPSGRTVMPVRGRGPGDLGRAAR